MASPWHWQHQALEQGSANIRAVAAPLPWGDHNLNHQHNHHLTKNRLERRGIFSPENLSMATYEQIQANRENAQRSTGPRTEEGKTRSSMNAVKTGLTGRTVLLPGDDAAAYEKHVDRFLREHRPVGDDESNLVQSLADADWRLLRIPALEAGIYAVGRLELASQFADEDPAVRSALIDAKTFLVYQKQLNNLSVQEGRLRRQRMLDLQALKELQKNRLAKAAKEGQAKEGLAKPGENSAAPAVTATSRPAEIGFEFSSEPKRAEFRRETAPYRKDAA